MFIRKGLVLVLALLLTACTIVPIEEVQQMQASETFDPVTYVDGIWESQVAPTIIEKAVDLPTVLTALEAAPAQVEATATTDPAESAAPTAGDNNRQGDTRQETGKIDDYVSCLVSRVPLGRSLTEDGAD